MPGNEKFALGIDLGGTNIKMGVVSSAGKIIDQTSVKSNAELGPKHVINQIITTAKMIIKNNKVQIKAIGIGTPGVVAVGKGTVENPPNFPGWKKINIAKILTDKLELKVYVENDANAAAIGEMIFGAGKKYDSFVMVTLGTGVGGGIIINRKIFHGAFGAAGELGHVTIDYKGSKCNCGSFGCIETYVGNRYLKARIREELSEHKDSLIWQLLDHQADEVSPRIIQQASEHGDQFAQQVIKDMGIQLGAALTSVSNLLDISTFVIGGGVAGFGKPLFNSISETIKKRVLTSIKPRVKVIPAKLKNNAGIKGASSLVFYKH